MNRKTYHKLVTRYTRVTRMVVIITRDLHYFMDRAQQFEDAKDYPNLTRFQTIIQSENTRLRKLHLELQRLQSEITVVQQRLQDAQVQAQEEKEASDSKKTDKILLLRRLLVQSTLYDLMEDETLYQHYLTWCEAHPRPPRTNRYVHMTHFIQAHPDLFRPMTPEEQEASAMRSRI